MINLFAAIMKDGLMPSILLAVLITSSVIPKLVNADIKMYEQEKMVLDFNAVDELDSWRVVNDGVMGGLSESEISRDRSNILVFKGNVSLENSGGFASTRTIPRPFVLDGYDGVLLRAKGDGKTYQFRLRLDDGFDGISFRFEFKTDPGKWVVVDVPFIEMVPVFRGRILHGVGPVQPEAIRQLGFLISKRQEGKFHLEVDWIKAYKK